MADHRLESANAIVTECFWGEYNLTDQDILERLDKNEPGFNRFLFSKIIENSRHPSKHIRILFPHSVFKHLLKRYLEQSGGEKRTRLIAANLTGDYNQAPEYQWRR